MNASPLSRVLAPQVSTSCRARGYGYFQAGAVHDLAVHDSVIVATVSGSTDYDVAIESKGSEIRASCTCPFFEDRLEICKHIWAAILAAEAKGLPLAAGAAVDDIDLVADANALTGDDDEFLETIAAGKPWSPKTAPHAAAAARPGPPPIWRQLLQTVAAPAVPVGVPPQRRFDVNHLLYVIDIAATLTAGGLVVELMARDRKANGDWGKPKAVRVSSADIRSLPDGPGHDDRRILQRLRGARPQIDYAGHYDNEFGQELARMRVSGVLVGELLPLMCATGRACARVAVPAAPVQTRTPIATYWAPKPTPTELLPLAWDAGAPWTFALAIRHDDTAATYAIEGSLTREGARMDVAEPLVVLADGVVITRTHAARLDDGGGFGWLAALRRVGSVAVPCDARGDILDALLAAPTRIAQAPDELRIEIADADPRPRLRLSPAPGRARIVAELSFDYDGAHVDAADHRALVRVGDSPRAVRRNADAERRHAATLRGLGCRSEWLHYEGRQVLVVANGQVPRLVRTLLGDGWHVEGAAGLYRRPGPVAVSVSSGIDWFDVNATVDYGGTSATLPQLLAARERGDTFVTLADGSLGLLPEDWLRTHGLLARIGAVEGDRVRFKASQVALLDALIEAQPAATWDDAYARARSEIQRFDGIAAIDPAPTFAGTLRGYQREGLGWLAFLQRFGFGGCLADDMGLGKTVMVLALLDLRRDAQPDADRRPSLVVAPRSVVFNWMREAARFTPRLRVVDYSGVSRASAAPWLDEADIVLTTYGTLRRDAPALAGRAFDYIVLDESQAIKNAATASAKAARLVNGRFRLALSGTPIENHLGELRSLFEFLNPGFFGRSVFGGAGNLDPESVALLSRGLRPFILRRTKEQVASELPPKLEQTLYCELEKPQRALYDELRDHYRRTLLRDVDPSTLKRRKLKILEALLRLRQAACHPGLVDRSLRSAPSAKLDMLLARLRETIDEGHKALVFSQFTSLLDIVRRELDARTVTYEYLDGRTRDREARVRRFQEDSGCSLFLISLKAGGVGLNLTAADSVFLLDPWWNPAVEAQAIDRTHRIGQTRHVFAYRLIARDTVEERVLELQQRKRQIADAILTATAGPLAALRREDLELLLS